MIEDVNSGNADIGLIRFYSENTNHFENQLKAKYIDWKEIYSFPKVVLVSKKHLLAKKDYIHPQELKPYTEIIHGDFEIDDYSEAYLRENSMHSSKRLIQVNQRVSLLDFIAPIEGSYTWTTATYPANLQKYELIEKEVRPSHSLCLDYIIYKSKEGNSSILKLVEEKISDTIHLFDK
ncbi:hypothetical protein [Facklamia sp. 7083-14-GEN3]|uniref:hypothetical protein n=1 Tax=Facklamia sp. 7083-14-GEN3 TaxID=2973478 RepID=UPI00215D0D06|nr:hypothetical protein [Facklamia sp. 7083-14-GEN3]MCR8968931.1 hypothetical protein [Facklamia sp. 7083-14-GEN3]